MCARAAAAASAPQSRCASSIPARWCLSFRWRIPWGGRPARLVHGPIREPGLRSTVQQRVANGQRSFFVYGHTKELPVYEHCPVAAAVFGDLDGHGLQAAPLSLVYLE